MCCILAMACNRRAASSWPWVSMVRVRSPSAMRSAACRASLIGLTILRVSSRAQIRVSAVAANSRPMTRVTALAYCSAAVWLISRVCSVLMLTNWSMTLLICSELLSMSRLIRLRRVSRSLFCEAWCMRLSSCRYWLSNCTYWL
ncbi:hypothetical protein D3C79_806280 [compost metagenome]